MPTHRSAASFACHRRPQAISSSCDENIGGSSRLRASHARISPANASSAALNARSIELQIPEAAATGTLERGTQRDLVVIGERSIGLGTALADPQTLTTQIVAVLLPHECALHGLVRAGGRELVDHTHIP